MAGLAGVALLAHAQQPAPAEAASPAAPRAVNARVAQTDPRPAPASLDTGLIKQRVLPEARTRDAFARKSWHVAPPAPPPPPPPPPAPPPPPPQAPPLPFKYLGQLQESATRTVWYLLNGERLIVAASGDLIDAVYRVEGADAGLLRFRYLPLDQRQTLTIGAAP